MKTFLFFLGIFLFLTVMSSVTRKEYNYCLANQMQPLQSVGNPVMA